MRRALLAAVLCACVEQQPRPPPRVADTVEVQHIRVGWLQIQNGRPDQPIVEDRRFPPKPDETEAREIALSLLEKCEKGAAMEPLQEQYSEVEPGVVAVTGASTVAFRDLALSLKPGECAMMRSDTGFHVIKRVR